MAHVGVDYDKLGQMSYADLTALKQYIQEQLNTHEELKKTARYQISEDREEHNLQIWSTAFITIEAELKSRIHYLFPTLYLQLQ
jgi:hypothetical protein